MYSDFAARILNIKLLYKPVQTSIPIISNEKVKKKNLIDFDKKKKTEKNEVLKGEKVTKTFFFDW